MPKAEAGSAKAVGNAMKARGLTQLRFYCQICSKACRDANGFKCHIESESHMRQIQVIGGNGMSAIDGFSKEFQSEFVQLLSRRFGTRRIKANQVYQEYIQERHHLHMNATKWLTLTEFIKHLGREGIVKVDETEQGWFISWVDNSPAALAKADSLKKLERAKMDDESRARKLLDEQIERAKLETKAKKPLDGGDISQEGGEAEKKLEEGLKRDTLNGSSGGIKLNIGFKKPGSSPEVEQRQEEKEDPKVESPSDKDSVVSSAPSTTQSNGFKFASSSPSPSSSLSSSSNVNPPKASNPLKPNTNPLKLNSNPLKAVSNPLRANPNPLKLNSNPLKSKSSVTSSSSNSQPSNQARTAAERIMQEEMERKRKAVGPVMNANIKRQKW